MSRTDKTKPFWVKLRHRDLWVVDEHDHRDGVCNLPAAPEVASYGPGHRFDCRWEFRYSGTHVCCCRLCHSADDSQTRPQKLRRMEDVRACRDWEREY